MIARDLADGRELLVAALAGADVARVDAVLVERGGAGRIAGEQQVPVVVEVADERRVQPASSMRWRISGTAAAASGMFTVMRTISEPASASAMHCAAVPAASVVSVLVIDWTTTGAPPPTWTAPGPLPTRTPTVRCTRITDMGGLLRRGPAPRSAAVGPDLSAVGKRRRRPMKCSMIASVSGGGSTKARPET